LLATLCLGIALANLIRLPALAALALAGVVALAATPGRVVTAAACLLAILGWWWGSARLDRLDQSVLRAQVGRAERALVVVNAAPRRGRFDVKMPVRVRRFGSLVLDEPAQLELPLGRAPPRGAILEVRAEAKLPRGPATGSTSGPGFDGTGSTLFWPATAGACSDIVAGSAALATA
jgi:hypothetical protein